MATMRDVAQLAGVSVATVSFVVNDTKPVSPETRERVENAMATVGYRRNMLASALASRRSRVIALLYPPRERDLQSAAFQFFINAANAAHEHGYTLVVSPDDGGAEEVANLVGSGLVEGVMVMEVRGEDARVRYLQDAGVPFVVIGRTRDPADLAYVDIDFDGTVVAALRAFSARARENVLLIDTLPAGEIDRSAYAPPWRVRDAFAHAVAAEGIRGAAVGATPNPASGREFGRRFRDDHPTVTAVLLHDEGFAAGFLAGLREAGVSVPTDLAVGLLNSTAELGAMIEPAMDVWAVPAREIGDAAVAALVGMLDGVAVTTQLVIPCSRVGSEAP